MKARLILSRYHCKCAACGLQIVEGARVWYDADAQRGKKCRHEVCNAIEQAPQPPQDAPQPTLEVATPNDKPAGNQKARREGKTFFADFASLTELFEYSARTPNITNNRQQWQSYEHHDGGINWYGTNGARDVERIAKEGWPEGVTKLLAAFSELPNITPPVSLLRRPTRGDHGDDYDTHAALQGNHDRAWTRRTRRQSVGTQNITIECHMQLLANVSAQDAFWRGAATLKLADALTDAGYHVEIIARSVTTAFDNTRHYAQDTICTVKEARAPLDLNALAAMLCLTGTYRLFFFRQQCLILDEYGKTVAGSLGQPTTTIPPRPEYAAHCIQVPADTMSQAKATQVVTNALNNLDPQQLAA